MTAAPFLPLHLGALHSYESWALAAIAFGPFVVLAIVVTVVRKRDIAADEAEPDGPVDPATRASRSRP